MDFVSEFSKYLAAKLEDEDFILGCPALEMAEDDDYDAVLGFAMNLADSLRNRSM